MNTFSLGEIDRVAERIIARVVAEKASGVALSGDLGVGKTTLAQALGKQLGVTVPIVSPTFILVRTYSATHALFKKFVHSDAYRIETEKEAQGLHLTSEPGSFLCVEWPDKLGVHIPDKLVPLSLSYISDDKRGIIGL